MADDAVLTLAAQRLALEADVSLPAAQSVVEQFPEAAQVWAPLLSAAAPPSMVALAQVRRGLPAAATPAMTWSELENDRQLFYDVAKRLANGGDIVEAATRLDGWQARAQQTHGLTKHQITVDQVFALAGITLDVRSLQRAEEATVRTLAQAVDTPRPAGEVDALGRVHFPPSVDLDELLADNLAPARAYREIRKLAQQHEIPGGMFVEDPDEFARAYRALTDAGVDMLGTARLAAHNDQIKIAAEAAERRTELAREQAHRDAVAAARQLARGAEEAVRALEAPTLGVPNPHQWR